jgi:hypothetical protein
LKRVSRTIAIGGILTVLGWLVTIHTGLVARATQNFGKCKTQEDRARRCGLDVGLEGFPVSLIGAIVAREN